MSNFFRFVDYSEGALTVWDVLEVMCACGTAMSCTFAVVITVCGMLENKRDSKQYEVDDGPDDIAGY
ncbi:hypothetical protein GR11A_00090 [Vibrio phage vB_VcorM_GR11A]|nr:hypothetical protein GR11A_00090 [Vibrio phage vB_VcorM_GR11A]